MQGLKKITICGTEAIAMYNIDHSPEFSETNAFVSVKVDSVKLFVDISDELAVERIRTITKSNKGILMIEKEIEKLEVEYIRQQLAMITGDLIEG